MANIFSNLTSIHARRLALSSTGAIVDRNGYGAVIADSSGVLQTQIKTYSEMISSSGAVLAGYGMSILSSGTATDRSFTISTPSSGQGKEIFSLSSASTITLETTATGVYFVYMNASAGVSSTKITFEGELGVFGQATLLRGLSSTRWAVLHTSGVV